MKELTANVQNTQVEEVEDINDIWNKIQKGINEAARKNNTQRSSWYEYECIEDKKKACNTMISRNTRQNKQEHKDKKICT
jgi:hypothetical protein